MNPALRNALVVPGIIVFTLLSAAALVLGTMLWIPWPLSAKINTTIALIPLVWTVSAGLVLSYRTPRSFVIHGVLTLIGLAAITGGWLL